MAVENRARPSSFNCTWLKFAVICVFLIGLFILYDFNSCNEAGNTYSSAFPLTTKYSWDEMREFAYKNRATIKPTLYVKWDFSFDRILENKSKRFNISGDDVLVFLHIQKTAGTSFEKFLVKYLDIKRPCDCNMGKKRCVCHRPNSNEVWLFSRYSTGWVCGLHADFTELYVSGCVEHVMDKKEGFHKRRRYYYTTFLRDPVERFISEYRHVERGATWSSARHVCNGSPPTPDQLPMCFDPEIGWEGVNLDEFLSCPYNLGFNRQTRMLADLTLIHCYDKSMMPEKIRDKIMLESAKNNLKNMAFFGIKERMEDSQYLFETIFNMEFTKSLADWNKTKSSNTPVTPLQLKIIQEKNDLDIQLYEFAIKLFEKRLTVVKEANIAADDGILTTSTPVQMSTDIIDSFISFAPELNYFVNHSNFSVSHP